MSEKRSLEDIFLSTFHNKFKFSEFLNLSIDDEYEKFEIKGRTIYSPSAKLKVFHRFINSCVFEYSVFNKNVVFSYRKGVTIRDAVEKHSTSKYFFQTDIKSFFSNITTKNIEKTLTEQLINIPVSDINNYLDLLVNYCVVDNHLPAGFSTSPILSNLCLYKFDNELENHAKMMQLQYTRYSDDIIVSSTNIDALHNITGRIEILLKQHINNNIKLNQDKTKTLKKGQRIKLLGLVILPNGMITVDKKHKKEIETLFYLYLANQNMFEDYVSKHFHYKNTQQKSLKELGVSTLSGKLIAMNSMDNDYINKLRKKYGNTIVEMFLRKSVK